MAARLIAEEGIAAGLVLTFEESDEWIIGRDPQSCDLVIADPMVSRTHARVRLSPDGYVIENLSDTNPVVINDQELLGSQMIATGDQIKIGETWFRFTTVEEEAPLKLSSAEEEPYQTLFGTEEAAAPTPSVDLALAGRWMLKVVAGPNTGAELILQPNHSYLLGTDAGSCDIVFHDLSVSRQHARIFVDAEEVVKIEDLLSRNGVVVDGKLITEPALLKANSVVVLGTTSFVLIDKEQAQETIFAAPLSAPEPTTTEAALSTPPATPQAAPAIAIEKRERPILSGTTLIFLLVAIVIGGLIFLSALSLFKEEEVTIPKREYNQELATALVSFPDIRFSYNATTGKLFLMGHLLTPVEKSELLYNLQSLNFITSIDDNVIVDQYVWEEYNAILAKNPSWNGASIYAPSPGRFILSGYLKTREQGTSLEDYLRVNFPFLDRLDNQLIIEEALMENVRSILLSNQFAGIAPELSNGELTLTGYIGSAQAPLFEQTLATLKQLPGIRLIHNFVVMISEESAIIDVSDRFPVQGFSQHNQVTINVLINGQILTRGDMVDGMKIISLSTDMVLLEKNGVKYKITYNK